MKIKEWDVLKSAGCNPATVSNSHTLRDRLLLPVLIFFWLIFSAMKCAFGFSVSSAQPAQEYSDRLTIPPAEAGAKIWRI